MNFFKSQSISDFYIDYTFYESVKNIVLSIYLSIIFLLIGIIVIEVKHVYNIDIFLGIDTPFDNVYYEVLPGIIDGLNCN